MPPDQIRLVVEEAARRRWQVTAHTAGEAAIDELAEAYEFVNRTVPLRDLRCCLTHANFPSRHALDLCKQVGIVADVQPAWLYKDGGPLRDLLGEERVRRFQPYRSWLEATTIGGGSDHMLGYDPVASTNPWSPWLGIGTAVTRKTESGRDLNPGEALTREQAIRLYTINNAYLTHAEKEKGSLEAGKLADLIVTDRDVMACPAGEIRDTKVVLTVVGGKVVHGR